MIALYLAPMDDVTDVVFRQIVAECARPDVFYTEFVNVDGLQSPGRSKLLPKLRLEKAEKPIIAQIWGKIPANFEKTAAELVEMGYDGVDINMGCPDKTIVKNGCCSALINNRELAVQIIAATKKGVAGRVPVSVKTRTGFNEVDFSWHELLLQQGLDMLVVHGRTRKQMSLVPNNWQDIQTVRELRDSIAPKTRIIGNGDVQSRAQAEELAKVHGLDGIMIGRAVFGDPFVFANNSPWQAYTQQQKIALYRKHVELFAATWKNGERKVATLNKFCKVYIQGFDGASDARVQLMAAKTTDELLEVLDSL